jgi:hypothetical protein
MTILEEVRHTLIFIEHDPLLYEDAIGMIDLLCCSTRQGPMRSWRI